MLHVTLLGEQSITDDGTGSVRVRSSRTVALIAFLALHAGSPQARQRITGLFWPDSTDAQALTNLRRELHNLRHVMGDQPSLAVTSRDLCWCDSEMTRVDVRTFGIERKAALAAAAAGDSEGILAHAACAIAQYRGELLPGMYDDWLLDARAELERQCADLCDLLCETRAGRGDLTGAVDAARRRIQLRSLEEAGYRTLMQLQADLGDRAGAVSTYHHCASVLERELGVVPDPATRQAAAAGRPGFALVCGGAAVGKTRLVAEIAGLARLQGAVVASAQCFGTSGRLALAPVADWVRNPAVQSVTATLDPAWRAEVDRLVPSGGRGQRVAGSRAMADAWQRHRFFGGLARALLAVGRPMLLVLDNMQWCDQETLSFLTFCLGLSASAQILVAGTLRDDNLDDDPELAGWTVRMRATGLLTELFLSPLEVADTARLAAAICGRPIQEADTSLLQATTGLPLVRHRGGSQQCRSRQPGPAGRRSHRSAARPSGAGDRGGPGGGRPGGRGGDELHPRSAH
jgi:DNA-binding SARP family transcriptional activator